MATPNEPTPTQSRSQQGPSQNGGSTTGQSSQGRESKEVGRQRPQGRALSRGQERRDLSTFASNPFELMRQMSRDMDRMMSAFLGGGSLQPRGWESEWATPTMWVPRIDVEQRGDSVCVRADLPGVRKEDVQIEVTDEGLMLSGERREEREEGGESQGYRSIERSYGSFYRMIPLPQKVNVDQLKAKMRDGVLEITVPLDESARARRIKIED